MRLVTLLLVVVVAVAIASCSSSGTGPKSPAIPFSLIGGGQTDTVNTTLTQALVVRTVPHQLVQFEAVPNLANEDGAFVESLTSPDPTTLIADSTDSNGQAAVVIYLGQLAGRAHVVVSLPKYGITDTATFTVLPGHLAKLIGVRVDTTVYPSATIALHGVPADRYGNPRSDPVTFHVLSGPVTLAGATVTATAIGLGLVATTAGSLADTTSISIVPHGRIAMAASPYIHIVNLDGSDSVSILPNIGGVGNVRWAPDGQSLVYDGMNGCYLGQIGDDAPIVIASLSGGAQSLELPASYYAYFPQYTRDGSRIYFTMFNPNGQFWQADPTTLATSVVGFPADQEYAPSPSPDGSQLAFMFATSNTTAVLRVITLSTGAMTDLGVPAYQPVWSPVSSQIAYIYSGSCQGQIHAINSDGSGDRTITAGTYNSGLDWSPDGAWIVALNSNTGHIDVINVASGQALPLTFTHNAGSPTWMPTAPLKPAARRLR